MELNSFTKITFQFLMKKRLDRKTINIFKRLALIGLLPFELDKANHALVTGCIDAH